MHRESQILKVKLKQTEHEFGLVQRDKAMLGQKCEELTSILGQAQTSLHDYETALENMRAHIDKGKAIKSKNKELKQHLRIMRENEDTLLRNIAELRR